MVKMKLSIVVTFLFIQKILASDTEQIKLDEKNRKKQLFYSYICDNEVLQNIEEKLKLIVDENDKLHNKMKLVTDENGNLRYKLDTLNMITSATNIQLTKLKTTISNLTSTISVLPTSTRQNESINSISTCSCDPMIDAGRNIIGSMRSQQSVIKSILPLPTSCAEAFQRNGYKSGIHKIYLPKSKLQPFYVYCLADQKHPQAPWTIIQRRQDGSMDFYRKWAEYQKGFGNMEGEFFIGLNKLHALTQSTLHELWVQLKDFKNEKRSAYYSSFAIGDSSQAYPLKILGSYNGDAGDSLKYHAGQKFSTHDMDNDLDDKSNCAEFFTGAWWYNNCYASNLNGRYLVNKTDVGGIVWKQWHQENYSLKYAHMAIRPATKNK